MLFTLALLSAFVSGDLDEDCAQRLAIEVDKDIFLFDDPCELCTTIEGGGVCVFTHDHQCVNYRKAEITQWRDCPWKWKDAAREAAIGDVALEKAADVGEA